MTQHMKMNGKDKELLFNEFEKFTRAGLTFEKATRALLDHPINPATDAFLKNIRQALKERSSFTEALTPLHSGINELDFSIIEAGEKGGRLSEAFSHLHNHYHLTNRTVRKIRRAAIYPAVLLHLGILLPSLPKLIASEDKKAVLLQTAAILLGLYLLLFLGWICFRQLKATATVHSGVDSLLNRIPLYGKLRKSFALSRFCSALSMSLRSAISPSKAITAAGKASQSGALAQSASNIHQSIREGSNLSTPMGTERSIPKAFTRSIANAELTGKLDEEADRWSKIYTDDSEAAADAIALWLPKIIYFAVAIFVAWQIISMYLGYINIIKGLIDTPL